jgi:hypothetical protein
MRRGRPARNGAGIKIPVALSAVPDEIHDAPKTWAERTDTLV